MNPNATAAVHLTCNVCKLAEASHVVAVNRTDTDRAFDAFAACQNCRADQLAEANQNPAIVTVYCEPIDRSQLLAVVQVERFKREEVDLFRERARRLRAILPHEFGTVLTWDPQLSPRGDDPTCGGWLLGVTRQPLGVACLPRERNDQPPSEPAMVEARIAQTRTLAGDVLLALVQNLPAVES